MMSRYTATKSRRNFNNDPGYDYRGKILLRHTDPSLWNNNKTRGFGVRIERILDEMIYQIKLIKKSVNFIVDINDDNIN